MCINNTAFEKREGNCLNRTQVLMRAEINEMKQFEALDPVKNIMRRPVCKFVFMDAILGFERITGDEKLRFLSWRDREQRRGGSKEKAVLRTDQIRNSAAHRFRVQWR